VQRRFLQHPVAGDCKCGCRAHVSHQDCGVQRDGGRFSDGPGRSTLSGLCQRLQRQRDPDDCDISGGAGQDCNHNQVPDECEPAQDCNQNGKQDICDIAGATSQDCNRNTVPDECESFADCNNNGVGDGCELGRPYSVESGHLSPIGADSPQMFFVSHPPAAGGSVTMTLTARADLGTKSPPCQCETLLVYFNNTYMGTFFQFDGMSARRHRM